MITRLNLSSQPYRNRTLPWAITAVLACASLVALAFIIPEYRRTNAQSAAIESDLQKLRRERTALQAQAAEVRESVPPDQLKVLDAAHALVDRKLFSWSRLLADLESSLPGNVRVARINVRDVSRQGGQTRADLDLVVSGRAPQDVTVMLTEMNRGGVFSVTPVSEKPNTARGEVSYEWTLRVGYVQRASRRVGDDGDAEGAESDVAASAATGSSSASNTNASSTRGGEQQ